MASFEAASRAAQRTLQQVRRAIVAHDELEKWFSSVFFFVYVYVRSAEESTQEKRKNTHIYIYIIEKIEFQPTTEGR